MTLTDRADELQGQVLARWVLEHFAEGVVVLDDRGRVIAANRAAQTGDFDVVAALAAPAIGCRREVLQLLAELRATGSASAEIECRARDGRSIGRLGLDGTALEGCYVVVVRDASEPRARAAELRELRGLASLGLLAANVAHDLNNLLTPIYALSSLLASRLPAEQRELAEEILDASERAARLARTVLTTARRTAPEVEHIDVNAVVAEMRPLIERLLGPGIELVLAPGDRPAATMIERVRLEHAILNLAVNARDAMANRGRLTISTSNVALGEPRFPELPGERPYVQIVVSDTGVGMSEEVRARMFDRFFTTKDAESGSGLGLASIRTLISDSGGGFISVQSAVGEGTAITLYLPIAEPGPASARSPDTGAPGGSETVLVIDPDEAVRRAVRRVLEAGGYRVLAADSEAAAVRAAAAARSVDLVLVDTAFPSIGEGAQRRRLLGRSADVPCLVMCGRALGERRNASPESERVLRKAFSSHELLHEVRRVLDAHRSGAARS